MRTAFQLHVTVQIEKVGIDENGHVINTYAGERLSVNEDHLVSAETFGEVCAILGQFHLLAETLNVKHKR